MRVGLAGYGLGGRVFHRPLIEAVDGLELGAVLTSRPVEGVATVREMGELIERSDVVAVSTPNHTHAPLAAAALDAGRHVVVDKPLALSAAEAEALRARAGGRLTVFQNR